MCDGLGLGMGVLVVSPTLWRGDAVDFEVGSGRVIVLMVVVLLVLVLLVLVLLVLVLMVVVVGVLWWCGLEY